MQDGPRWVCDEPVVDFGEVWEGATIKHDFVFRNAGTEVLKIEKPKAHCSCSTAENYTREVAPGESGIIPFVLKTVNKLNGPLKEYLIIKTNDPSNQSMRVWLKGFVRKVVHAEAVYDALYERDKAAGKVKKPLRKRGNAAAGFGRIKSGDGLHRIIKMRNTSGQHPLSLTLQPLPPDSKYQVEFKEVVPGEEFELTVTAEPPIPEGRWRTQIWFKTNVPERPVYRLFASSYVPPRVEVIPPKIVINRKKYPAKERDIRIINNGETPVDVVSIATSEPRYVITLLSRDPAKPNEQRINVVFPGGKGYEPPAYGELIQIKTKGPEKPVFDMWVVPTLQGQRTPRPSDKPLELHPVDLSKGGG